MTAIDGAASDASQQIKVTSGTSCVRHVVAHTATVTLGIASIKEGGEVFVVGLYGGELKLPIVYLPLRGMGLQGSYVGSLPELKELVALAQKGALKPIKVTCADHEGARTGRIQTWDGKNWKVTSDWYTADDAVVAPGTKGGKYQSYPAGCLTNYIVAAARNNAGSGKSPPCAAA
jgi:hypothetical protein